MDWWQAVLLFCGTYAVAYAHGYRIGWRERQRYGRLIP